MFLTVIFIPSDLNKYLCLGAKKGKMTEQEKEKKINIKTILSLQTDFKFLQIKQVNNYNICTVNSRILLKCHLSSVYFLSFYCNKISKKCKQHQNNRSCSDQCISGAVQFKMTHLKKKEKRKKKKDRNSFPFVCITLYLSKW